MKLTEQQLAQMFRQNKNGHSDYSGDLNTSSDASDQRLRNVEMIADNSQLSASYQIINQLHDWSQAIGNDIELSLKPKFTASLFNWLRPTLATAAIVTTVYFITPQINNNIQHKSDHITFNTNFESNADVIQSVSFDKNTITNKQQDIITKLNFS